MSSSKYSRLSRLEEKRNLRKAIMMGTLGIAIVVITIIFGIPALVRLAVFFGDINSSNKPIDKNDIIAPAPPSLYSLYDATNSATIDLSGTTEPGASVFLTNNGIEAGDVVAKDDGVYQFLNVKLNSGDNTFATVAIDQGNNRSQPSRSLNVYFSTKEPKLEIEAPTDRENIANSERQTEVRGKTDANSKVTVNDRFVFVADDGSFSYKLNLSEGENTIVVVSTDRAGNSSRKELVVTYTRW